MKEHLPQSRREWAFLAAGAFMAFAILWVAGERYRFVGSESQALAWRFDRWTGAVAFCAYPNCTEYRDAKPK